MPTVKQDSVVGTEPLFSPIRMGAIELANRIVMAPMTRNRAGADGVPNELMVEHYAARAEAGLIVAEGTWPSVTGQAYCRQPGIETAEQMAAWRKVTDAVHAKGGKIVLQIMHAGRIGSDKIKPAGVPSVAPSAIQAKGEVFTDAAGMQPFDQPHALTTDEVVAVVEEHRQAAINAREAGFDGVELHCTSGYLPMQFLCSGTNQRDDHYGGSLENRVRFAAECLQAMGDAIGRDRVGFRINPGNTFNDTSDDDSVASHVALMQAATRVGVAFVHIMRAPDPAIDAFALAREHFKGSLILNDSFEPLSAADAIREEQGDAVSFARHFIANPDLVTRIRKGLALTRFDRKTIYTAGPEGYTDYPVAAE
ncbi:NADPH2 dehydrogenase/N-ethylmaleimide reductase [Marinobacterium halophilum]|uniref:NADPH2 dehydrogenase/N-ethylmaleimide reductase n=1 Tax=Marinobacterium halophilum TaxID=267374 RepID=A0A2P8F2E7_9GAMM|nr:alkene reductase [Marinobacterium halophilum]PSL15891.1 NADPH2 dehydrogenase/N-ethylmaleimide reductase [Marinobacterium halophilum]